MVQPCEKTGIKKDRNCSPHPHPPPPARTADAGWPVHSNLRRGSLLCTRGGSRPQLEITSFWIFCLTQSPADITKPEIEKLDSRSLGFYFRLLFGSGPGTREETEGSQGGAGPIPITSGCFPCL